MTQSNSPRRVNSVRADRTARAASAFMDYYTKSTYAKRKAGPNPPRFDFVTGNPFELPMPTMVEAMTRALQPKNPLWYAYSMNEKPSCELAAASLTKRLGLPFDPADVLMTTGAFSAMEVAFKLVADPGDEIIVMTPWFFLYPTVFEGASVEAVKVPLGPSFELDLPAIRKAVGPRTRGILINSPHNPTGRLVRPEELKELADILAEASAAQGRPVYLISDEAFSRIVYDGRTYETPVASYPHSILIYTYGKQLLAPGERIGYVALPSTMPEADRKALRDPLFHMAIGSGFCFPNSTLQRALPELDALSIDVEHLQGNRDLFRDELTKVGYEVVVPEGTFFMLVKAPMPDDLEFSEILAQHDIFVTPGTMCLAHGYLRVSLCSLRETVRDSIPGWRRAFEQVRPPR